MSEALHGFQVAGRRFGEGRAASGRAASELPVAVLHLFKYFRPDFTGDGLYFEKLIPRLERQGVRNEVAAEMTRARPGVGSGARLFGRFRHAHLNPLLLLWFFCNAWRFDVVHLHSAIDRVFIYHLIARMFGCRVVQSCTLEDGMGNVVLGYRPRYRPLVRHLVSLIDDVVAISPSLYADTVGVVRPSRVHLIPQGVSVRRDAASAPRNAMRQAYGVEAEDTLLLFVGGICPRKDAQFLVENHPTELGRVKLMLVGPVLDDAYAAGLRAAIAASPAAGRMQMCGYMEDPTPAYRAADIFVFASHKEGCPNVLLEAMAHGLPSIARRLPGTTDTVLDDGRTGVLFDTAAEYVAAVRMLAADPAARQAMGAAAHSAATTVYDMDAIAGRYAALYRKAA